MSWRLMYYSKNNPKVNVIYIFSHPVLRVLFDLEKTEMVTISPPSSFAWEWELSQTFYCPQPHSLSEKTNFLQKKNIHVSVVSLLLQFVLDLHFICIEFTLLGVSNFTRQIQAWACHLHSMCLPPFCLIQKNMQQCVKQYISRLVRGKKNQNHLVYILYLFKLRSASIYTLKETIKAGSFPLQLRLMFKVSLYYIQ